MRSLVTLDHIHKQHRLGDQTVRALSDVSLKIDRGESFVLVETLPAASYHHAHLPGAINLPPDQMTQLASTLLPDKTADIVVYCAKPT